jgi:hypothetical protein
MSKCFILCNEQSYTYTGTLSTAGDSDNPALYYTVAGAPSCYLEVEVEHTGTGIVCREVERWGSCGFGFECEAQQAYTLTDCYNVAGTSAINTPDFEDMFRLFRGDTVTRYYSCQVGLSESLHALDVTRNPTTGAVTCGTPTRVSGAPGNIMRVFECR